jgi:hypothetical protein
MYIVPDFLATFLKYVYVLCTLVCICRCRYHQPLSWGVGYGGVGYGWILLAGRLGQY